MQIEFYKYQGTGNDFIIIDNRNNTAALLHENDIRHICDRHFGIGADGLMMLNNKEGFDFEMKYYNADGKPGSMCGNGARCIVKFISDLGIQKSTFHFTAADGSHEAEINESGMVRLKMIDVNEVNIHSTNYELDTGSPHFVIFRGDVKSIDVKQQGRQIRYSNGFAAEGINVNFVSKIADDEIYVRTYERGVEDETLSCGTGVTASAIVSAHNENGFNRVEVGTSGGRLSVEFDKLDENHFTNIWLIGPAKFVFKGSIKIDKQV